MTRFLRKISRDERGATIVELGLVMPILASLLIGMVDVARAYSHKLQLEQSAHRAIEKVMQYHTDSSTYDTLYAEAATAAGVATSAVEVDYWLECNGVRMTGATMAEAYEQNCPTGEVQTRYISVEIDKKFTPMFGIRYFPGANPDGTITVSAEAGMRTQ